MPLPQETAERFSAEVTCLAADATKVILAAKAGRRPVVTYCHVIGMVLAAQAFDIQSSDGAVNIIRGGASLPVNAELFYGPLVEGVVLPVGTGIRYQPAAAGPGVHVVVEGYYGVAK
jgi:hypothetical protein